MARSASRACEAWPALKPLGGRVVLKVGKLAYFTWTTPRLSVLAPVGDTRVPPDGQGTVEGLATQACQVEACAGPATSTPPNGAATRASTTLTVDQVRRRKPNFKFTHTPRVRASVSPRPLMDTRG